MSDAWNEMGKAKENAYFEKKNHEAIDRLAKKQLEGSPRLSPISGKPMEQVVISGVIVDRCTESGGIWLDSGELEQILEASKKISDSTISTFFKEVLGIDK